MLNSISYLSQGSHQGHLETVLRNTFKGVDIKVNERNEIDVRNPHTGNKFEVDIWIPQLSLGFEFQDAYHFVPTWYTQVPIHEVQASDRMKRKALLIGGIDLISVPCWWNLSPESLHSSIRFERPDILHDDPFPHPPIPLNPPFSFFTESTVPHVGDLMLATFVDSPTTFSDALSSSNPWWIGEKYDGVRAIWNPVAKQLYSRRAIEIQVPLSLLHFLGSCNLFIDGEAWQGRGLYSALGTTGDGCEFLRMIAFDEPSAFQRNFPFEMRYASLVNTIQEDHPFFMIGFRRLCSSTLDLTKFLNFIISDGGEGVIARKPKSVYESGRSSSLIKLKSTHGDTEGLVAHMTSERDYILELPSGLQFKVKKEDVEVEAKPGDIVTFSYEHYSRREIPLNPRITRIRKDLSWETILLENNSMSGKGGFTTKPANFWEDDKNIRKFFEDFAVKRNLDPLDANTWYSTTRADIESDRRGYGVCRTHGGYVSTVMAVFPDILFDVTKFKRLPAGYFNNMSVRRESFLKFAKENNFDPLVASNWYYSRRKRFSESAGEIIRYYKSIKRALVHVFPELRLDASNVGVNYYAKAKNRRLFFDNFARKHKFDPLIPANWYDIPNSRILQEPDGKTVLGYYDRYLRNALLELYPEIGLDKWKFSKRKKVFFDAFAKDNGFDPLVAANWYKIPRSQIMGRKNAEVVMAKNKGSVVQTLMQTYPNIGLQENLFLMRPVKYWANVENQRKFFDEIATSNGLDPLVASTWHSLRNKLPPTKGLNFILSNYSGDLSGALKAVYPKLQLGKLKLHVENHWADAKNRRAFFEKFAKSQGFDPLVAENWYTVPRTTFMQDKNANYVLQYHDKTFATALVDLFPEITIDKNRLHHLPRRFWANADNQKDFFIKFARENGFDPLDPEKWYKVSRKQILDKKGGQMVIGYYSSSYQKALLLLFPNIGLVSSKFEKPNRSFPNVQ